MLKERIIPILLFKNHSFVKTKQFKKYNYVGDPCNTVRIFNEVEVDELIVLDITASGSLSGPNYKVISELSKECFMPLTYGGGISNLDEAKKIFGMGIEKISINYSQIKKNLVYSIAREFGSQAVIGAVDIKKDLFGSYKVFNHVERKYLNASPVNWVKHLENEGVGEILLTSVDREGTWFGLDANLTALISSSVSIPVITHGGANSKIDIENAINLAGASAVGVGNLVVYLKKGSGILVNYPFAKA